MSYVKQRENSPDEELERLLRGSQYLVGRLMDDFPYELDEQEEKEFAKQLYLIFAEELYSQFDHFED